MLPIRSLSTNSILPRTMSLVKKDTNFALCPQGAAKDLKLTCGACPVEPRRIKAGIERVPIRQTGTTYKFGPLQCNSSATSCAVAAPHNAIPGERRSRCEPFRMKRLRRWNSPQFRCNRTFAMWSGRSEHLGLRQSMADDMSDTSIGTEGVGAGRFGDYPGGIRQNAAANLFTLMTTSTSSRPNVETGRSLLPSNASGLSVLLVFRHIKSTPHLT